MKKTQKNSAFPLCVWQQAGVVKKKECRNDYSCPTCRFNRAMIRVCQTNKEPDAQGVQSNLKSRKFIIWEDQLKKLPPVRRPCVHHMKGRIRFRSCLSSYRCSDCEFDQFFEDQFRVHTVLQPVSYDEYAGIQLPAGYYLHPGHVWLKIEGDGMVRIGMDDFAARLFGDFDRLDATNIGKQIDQGTPIFSFFRQQHLVEFVSPVKMIVTQVNKHLRKDPGLSVRKPYTDGWVMMGYCADLKKDIRQLMFMDSSRTFFKAQVDQLYGFLEEHCGLDAADGGELVGDIYGSMDNVSWDLLVEKFIQRDL